MPSCSWVQVEPRASRGAGAAVWQPGNTAGCGAVPALGWAGCGYRTSGQTRAASCGAEAEVCHAVAPGWPRCSWCPLRLKAEEGAVPEQLWRRAAAVLEPHSTTMCPWAAGCQKVTHTFKKSQRVKKGEPNHLKQSVLSALCPRDTQQGLKQDAVQPSGSALRSHSLRQHGAALCA